MDQTLMRYVGHGPALPVCAFGAQYGMRVSLLTHLCLPHTQSSLSLVVFVLSAGFTAEGTRGSRRSRLRVLTVVTAAGMVHFRNSYQFLFYYRGSPDRDGMVSISMTIFSRFSP